jgi:type I restriction enzyme S subunit
LRRGTGVIERGTGTTDIPWIKSGELNDGEIFSTEESLTDEGIKQSAAQVVEPGTNLIALYGATAGVVGRARIRAAINQAILAVVPNDGDIIPDFLQFLLQRVGSETAKISQGAQPNLNAGIVQERIISLPPYNEQLRIAAILQTWADSIRKVEKHLALKENLRRGLMHQLLTGQTRFDELKAERWRTVRLGDLLEECDRYVNWSDGTDYRFASIRRRSGGLFDRGTFYGREIKTKVLKLLKAGDFVISKRQVVHGAWAMVPEAFDGFGVSDEYDVLVNRDANVLDMRFFNYLSQTRRLWHMAYLASNGVHIEKLIFDFDDFAKEKIKIPPTVAEQEKIVAVLSACDEEIKLLEKQLEALKEQKRGLMQKLLTGEVRVKT